MSLQAATSNIQQLVELHSVALAAYQLFLQANLTG